jgi:preprotein translocase subunit SecG
MTAVRIVLQALLVLTSAFMTLLILMHKGKGGGLSDMFGGGMSSNLGSSGVAEKNLNRITVGVAGLWLVAVILLDLVQKFAA